MFNIWLGKYEFLTMLFGLTNVPMTFQCIMNEALWDLTYWNVIIYLDNIVVYLDSAKEYEAYFREVFKHLD